MMWRPQRLAALRSISYSSQLRVSTSRPSSGQGEATEAEQLNRDYIVAMRAVPTPVVVVTTSDGSVKRGVTCGSFASVSLQPPIISFAMQLHSRMHQLLLATQRFAANILSEQQANCSVHFSRPPPETSCQFDSIPHHTTPDGLPILSNCLSVLQCSAHDVHTVGDHHVWYGKVCHASNNNNTPPLLYYDRSYRSVGDEMFMRAFEAATLGYEEWTHEAHVRMAWNYLTLHGREVATPIIRNGIRHYIDQNYGKVKTVYNETITLFFIHMVDTAMKKCEGSPHTFEEFLAASPHLSDPELLSRYYSLSRFHSSEARNRWLEPDLQPLP